MTCILASDLHLSNTKLSRTYLLICLAQADQIWGVGTEYEMSMLQTKIRPKSMS